LKRPRTEEGGGVVPLAEKEGRGQVCFYKGEKKKGTDSQPIRFAGGI